MLVLILFHARSVVLIPAPFQVSNVPSSDVVFSEPDSCWPITSGERAGAFPSALPANLKWEGHGRDMIFSKDILEAGGPRFARRWRYVGQFLCASVPLC